MPCRPQRDIAREPWCALRVRPIHGVRGIERLPLATALLLAPVPAAAHNPGAAVLSLVILGAVASLLAIPVRRLLVRRWSGSPPRRRALAAATAGEILLAAALVFVLFSYGPAAWAASGLVSVVLLVALHHRLLPAAGLSQLAMLALAWPAIFVLLALLVSAPLYVLLGG